MPLTLLAAPPPVTRFTVHDFVFMRADKGEKKDDKEGERERVFGGTVVERNTVSHREFQCLSARSRSFHCYVRAGDIAVLPCTTNGQGGGGRERGVSTRANGSLQFGHGRVRLADDTNAAAMIPNCGAAANEKKKG